jgi:hypothetical protein
LGVSEKECIETLFLGIKEILKEEVCWFGYIFYIIILHNIRLSLIFNIYW